MFHTFFYEPIYNLLVIVLTLAPLHDIGTTIVVVTCMVKGLLLPLNLSALKSQYMMKRVEKELKQIKDNHKNDPQTVSRKTMEVYKREKINPFSSLFLIILQIPILFALYFVFRNGLHADPNSLYPLVHFPEVLHTKAFGLFDVTQKNIFIAVLAGISSYFLAKRQTESMIPQKDVKEESFQDQFMKSMKIQMLYVLPLIIIFSASVLPAALGLYWFVSNTIGYFQDVYMKKKLAHLKTV